MLGPHLRLQGKGLYDLLGCRNLGLKPLDRERPLFEHSLRHPEASQLVSGNVPAGRFSAASPSRHLEYSKATQASLEMSVALTDV